MSVHLVRMCSLPGSRRPHLRLRQRLALGCSSVPDIAPRLHACVDAFPSTALIIRVPAQDATRRDTAVGAMKQYARALIDGNLAEVAIYAGNGPGAVFKGTDSHGNRCESRCLTCCDIEDIQFGERRGAFLR